MDQPTYREKSTMTTLSDSLTSQLQMYINNNMVQSHINICSSNLKPEFLYDNLLDCSAFNTKSVDYNKPSSNTDSTSWEYSHHHGFPFGRCITCPIVSSPSAIENDKDINFSLLRNIATHIKVRTVGEMMYKCIHCKANFEEKCDYINHVKAHVDEIRPISEDNNYNAGNMTSAATPSSSDNRANVVNDVVATANVRAATTNNHSNSANNSPNNNNNVSNNNSNNNVMAGTVIVANHQSESVKRFVCQCCNTSYSRKSNLNAHMRSHADGKKAFSCDYCQATYSRKANLNTHVRIHSDDTKPFRCNMCEAIYSRKSSLDAHVRIHMDASKPFRCDFCGATYSRKTNLNSHVKIHTVGRQPFTCELCNASYSRKTNLNAHIRTHTTGKLSFKCEYCSVQYSRKTNLNIHVRTHTGEKPYKCKQCSEAFSRRTDLNTHSKSHASTTENVIALLHQPSSALTSVHHAVVAATVEMNKSTYQQISSSSLDYLVPKQTCTYESVTRQNTSLSNVR